MKRIIAAVTILASGPALADGVFQYDPTACAKLAKRFSDNQFVMSVNELDNLQLCAGSMKAMVVQQKTSETEVRSIERNFASNHHEGTSDK